MPIYEYKCADCGAVTELLVRSATETAQPVCASCGSADLRKLFSTVNVSFRGDSCARDRGFEGPGCGAACAYGDSCRVHD
jgi:putative FmdB family regulatory protein